MAITGWAVLTISSAPRSEEVASQLLDRANDAVTWTIANMGATVIRCQGDDGDDFYFSPQARSVFADVIARHQPMPCDPPRTRELAKAKTSRMMLGFKTRWEPFVQVPAAAKGVPRSSGAPGNPG